MQHERIDSAAAPKPKAARRTKSNRYPGVYYRETPRGRRYEITFRDSMGKQRWKVVDGGEQEARDALDEIRRKLRRGERVAPTKQTVAQVADAWLATQGELRPRTREKYDWALKRHILPRLGRLKIAQVTEDHVAVMISELLEQGYKPWTVRSVLTPLGRVFSYAARRGLIAGNPVDRLERGERPTVGRRDMRILNRDEIGGLLQSATTRYRPLLATAVFTGLRIGELLGVTWANVDFEAGVVRVRRQLNRSGQRVEPKTPQAVRDVVLMPALARVLREHRLQSAHTQPDDLVFASSEGTGLDHRNVARRGLAPALERAGLNGGDRPALRFHDLRHTFASLLVAQGANVVFVSRQLGHASPDITLGVYAHLFDAAEHADRASAALEASFGAMLDGNELRTATGAVGQPAAIAEGGKVAFLPGAAPSGA